MEQALYEDFGEGLEDALMLWVHTCWGWGFKARILSLRERSSARLIDASHELRSKGGTSPG